MKTIFLLISVFATIGLSAQKTVHDANAVTRSAKNFHAIEISDGIDLYLSQSNEEAVAVSGSSDEYRDKIKVEVINGVLKVYYDRKNGWSMNWGNRKLKAYVSAKSLDHLSASGGADVFIDNELAYLSFKKANRNPKDPNSIALVADAIAKLNDIVDRRPDQMAHAFHIMGSQGLTWAKSGIPPGDARKAFIEYLLAKAKLSRDYQPTDMTRGLYDEIERALLMLAV